MHHEILPKTVFQEGIKKLLNGIRNFVMDIC